MDVKAFNGEPTERWPSVEDEDADLDLSAADFAIYTPQGFLQDWNQERGEPATTRRLEDAALWSSPFTAWQCAQGVNGCVLRASDARLLTIAEILADHLGAIRL